jgi:hypothetical protein
MSEPKVRRVAIACDASCDIRVAVAEAAALARRWNAALHGVFLEDENLFRLAGLPFGRQMTLSPEVTESFSGTDLETVSAALSAAMRRAVSEAAAQHGLEWSFGTLRDLPSAEALAEIEADIVVVDAAPREFAGSWRPPSAWDSLIGGHARTTLIKRQKPTRPGTVLVLIGKSADHEKTLSSGLLMAGPEDTIRVLIARGGPVDVISARQLVERLGPLARREIQFEPAPAEASLLVRRATELAPVLLVADAHEADDPAFRDLLLTTPGDVLLVR